MSSCLRGVHEVGEFSMVLILTSFRTGRLGQKTVFQDSQAFHTRLLVLEGALRDIQIIAKFRLRNPSLRRHATHR